MHQVIYIDDDQLPASQTWTMVQDGCDFYLFIKRSAVHPRALEGAWEAYDRMLRRPIPGQRISA